MAFKKKKSATVISDIFGPVLWNHTFWQTAGLQAKKLGKFHCCESASGFLFQAQKETKKGRYI